MTDDELKDIERTANADRHPSARRTEALLRELRHARAELKDARALVKTREKELADERATSEGRRKALVEKADELRAEWLRAERAEGERDALRAELAAVDEAAHGGGTEHTGTARVVARALADAAQVAESLYAERDALRAEVERGATDNTAAIRNLTAQVERLKQEVTYADRAMHERQNAFTALHADVSLLARDLGLLGEGEEAPADREALWHFMRRAQDAARDQRARLVDLAKDRDTALAAALDLAADRDAMRALLDGSEVAPTDEEIIEHARAGGGWIVTSTSGMLDAWRSIRNVRHYAAEQRERGGSWRWLAVSDDGRVCPRPVPPPKP